jgi:hypothetical protein
MSILSDATIRAVIAQVTSGDEINVDDLRNDLDWAQTHYQTREIVAMRHRLSSRLASVQGASKKLSRFLADAEIRNLICMQLPADADIQAFVGTRVVGLDAIQRIMEMLATAAGKITAHPSTGPIEIKLADDLGIGRRGAFEWLVGERLPETYSKHFKRRAGISRNPATGSVSGPYIRFATFALNALAISNRGRPYSAESIAKALADARTGRTRKKHGAR